MHWLVGNWQLKLLSIGLTMILLVAIGFTQNPPTELTMNLHLAYSTPPSQLVLLNPPESVQVHVVGLQNSVRSFQQKFGEGPGATVDLAGMGEGSDQPVDAVVTASQGGVSVSPSRVPIRVDLEQTETKKLPINVRVSGVNSSAGLSVVKNETYATCGSDTEKCQVSVTAPSSLLRGLQAYLSYQDPEPSQAGIERVPGLPIQFERYGKPINLADQNVIPKRISVIPEEATARVQTQGGTLQTTAPVFVRTTGTLACGFQVQSLSYSPATVTISGPTQEVTKLQSVQLDPVDVTGVTTSETVSRDLTLPNGVQAVSGTPTSVSVTVTVAQAYSCTPSSGGGTGSGGGSGSGSGGGSGSSGGTSGTSGSTPTPAPTAAPKPTPTATATPG